MESVVETGAALETEPRHAFGRWLPLVAAALVAAVTLDGDFVFDDTTAILGNPVVTGQVPWYEAWTRSFWGWPIDAAGVDTYRPLGTLYLTLLHTLFGDAPLGYRAMTVVLHVGAVWAGYRVLLALRVDEEVADAGALLFATHAVHAQALGMIVGQVDLLSTLLGLLAVERWLAGRRARFASAALLLLVACLVKESAFVFGLAVLGLCLVKGTPRERRMGAVPVGLVVAGIVALQLALPRIERIWSQGLVYGVQGVERVALGLVWFGKAVRLCVVPTGLVPSHGYAEVAPSLPTLAPDALLGMGLLLVCLAGSAVALRRGASAVLALAILGLGPLVLVSSLVVRTPTDLPERLLYGASFAVSGLAAIGTRRGMPDGARRRWAAALLAFAMACGGAMAQRPWVSTLDLADYAVETAPLVMHHHAYRAVAASNAGSMDVASYELGLAAYLFNRYPRPVDAEHLHRYAERHAPNDWLSQPSELFEGDPCVAVSGLLRAARAQVPSVEAHMLAGFANRYPRCFVRR